MPWTPGPGPTAGDDIFVGEGESGDVFGHEGNDQLYGMGGVDWLYGEAGDDFLSGGDESDRLTGGGGRDSYDGGASLDWAWMDYSGETLGIRVDNSNIGVVSTILRGGLAYGTIVGVENLNFVGGTGDDYVHTYAGDPNALMNYNTLDGRAGNDTLIGSLGSDTLIGGAGNDYMDGGVGDQHDWVLYDTASGGITLDLAITTAQNTGGDGVDTVLNVESVTGSNFNDVLFGDGGDNFLEGRQGNDQVTGRDGNDWLRGHEGDDILEGGAGNDTIDPGEGYDLAYGGDGDDSIGGDIAYGGDGNDRIGMGRNTSHPLVRDDTQGGAGYGGAGDDNITGSEYFDIFDGGEGNDTLNHSYGGDIYLGGAGNDTIDLIEWTYFDLYEWAEWIADNANGGSGDDFIRGGYGDVIDGGDGVGDRALLLLENPFNIFESFNLDFRTFDPNVSFALPGGGSIVNVENISHIYLGIGADTLYDDDSDTHLDGMGGNDVIYAMGGNDFVNGNGNNDLIYGGDGDDDLFGSLGDDQLFGGTGNDILEGFFGSDLIDGGDGDDVIWIDSLNSIHSDPGQSDVIHGGAGLDTITFRGVWGGVTFSLSETGFQHIVVGPLNDLGFITADGVENLAGTWYNDTLTGNELANFIYGDFGNDAIYGLAGDDVIDGGGGGAPADLIDGGDGVDTVLYDTYDWDGGVSVYLLDPSSNTGAAAGDSYVSIENIRGSLYNDDLSGDNGANVLWGDAGNDQLFGEAGNDTLNGGAGADTMIGGDGDDTYVVDNAGDAVTENASEGADTVQSSITYTLGANVENLTLTGAAAINGTGNTLANTIIGNSGANTLSGGDGNDTLNGGLGVDALNGGTGNDTFLYALGDGNGAMDGGDGTDALNVSDGAATGILNATWNGAAVTVLSGNTLASIETITANLGGGVDWLVYAAGSAAVTVNLATNSASGFFSISNIERVVGGNANDTLTGNGLDNRLDGGAGDDVLAGGGGVDTLIGGDGADTLAGGLSNDSVQGGAGADTVTWSVGEGRDTVDGGADFDTFNAAGSASADLGNASWNGASLTALMDNGLANMEAVNLDLGGAIDWLIYNTSFAVTVNLATNSASGFASVTNTEKVIGGSGDDSLTGDGLDNRLDGQGGGDTLDGGAGSDAVLGGDGDDIIYASAGNDSLQGQAGNDSFIWVATDGRDTFNGGADSDTVSLTGSAAADVADANWNGTAITGLLNNALVDIEAVNLDLGAGGAGGDWLRYNSALGVAVDLGAGTATGFASITGIENLIGGTGGDSLTGDGGANKINGNNGDDVITGGGGADNLTGGIGSDTFVYAAGAGNDTIVDFDAWAVGGQDFLDVASFGINAGNFATRVAIIDTGADTVIRIDNTYFITLKNVSGDGDNVITNSDFIFGP